MNIQERYSTLCRELTKGLYEKDREVAVTLLTAIAGESILLLGPPGVAKSMIARRIRSAFVDAEVFEYLMSRFSTPDDIFGPVSISRLKQEDSYERITEGFLPTADIVFLDEIWKAGPAILNTLLTIVNEKTFRNGKRIVHVPMKLLIGASNELPAAGEGLEALWDRFLVRMECGCVKEEENFYKILNENENENETAAPTKRYTTKDEDENCHSVDNAKQLADDCTSLAITAPEYAEWQAAIRRISIAPQVLECITYIRQHLSHVKVSDSEDANTTRVHNIYISDRRWKHIAHLLRTSAFVNGRTEVTLADVPLLLYCLWNEPEEIDAIVPIIANAILQPVRREIETLETAVSTELKNMRVRQALRQAQDSGDTRDENKEIFNNFYYRIDNYGTGNTYIFLVDYRNLPTLSRTNAPTDGIIYPDPTNPKRNIIRSMADAMGLNINGVAAMRVKLYRGSDDIYLNGVKYPIHTLPRGQRQQMPSAASKMTVGTDYESQVEELSARLRAVVSPIMHGNALADDNLKRQIDELTQALNKQIAMTRYNLQKLLYED